MNNQYTDEEIVLQIQKLRSQHAYITANMIQQLFNANQYLKKTIERLETTIMTDARAIEAILQKADKEIEKLKCNKNCDNCQHCKEKK